MTSLLARAFAALQSLWLWLVKPRADAAPKPPPPADRASPAVVPAPRRGGSKARRETPRRGQVRPDSIPDLPCDRHTHASPLILRPPSEDIALSRLSAGHAVFVKGPTKIGKSTFVESSLSLLATRHLAVRRVTRDIRKMLDGHAKNERGFLRAFAQAFGSSEAFASDDDLLWSDRLTAWMKTHLQAHRDHWYVLVVDGALPSGASAEDQERIQLFHNELIRMLNEWAHNAVSLTRGTREIWGHLRIVFVDPFVLEGALDEGAERPAASERPDGPARHPRFNESFEQFLGSDSPVRLEWLDDSQVRALAVAHGLDSNANAIVAKLREPLGGHPYLLCVAMNALRTGLLTLDGVLEDADQSLQEGIFWLPLGVLFRHVRPGRAARLLQEACKKAEITPNRAESASAQRLVRAGILRSKGGNTYCLACGLFRRYANLVNPWQNES